MRTAVKVFLMAASLSYSIVPCVQAVAMTYLPTVTSDIARTARSLQRVRLHKRSASTVDAWSMCPPNMTDMDCFYAYLHLYARLRKAAEESDRVSMRNIGKRMSSDSADDSATEVSSLMAGAALPRLLDTCPENISLTNCYEIVKTIHRKILANLEENESV